ncbi:MAG TPA: hypothetical protein VGI78_29445 [Acetobacteraceae bacterium]
MRQRQRQTEIIRGAVETLAVAALGRIDLRTGTRDPRTDDRLHQRIRQGKVFRAAHRHLRRIDVTIVPQRYGAIPPHFDHAHQGGLHDRIGEHALVRKALHVALRGSVCRCLDGFRRHHRGIGTLGIAEQCQRLIGLALIEQMQRAIVQQPRRRRLVRGTRHQTGRGAECGVGLAVLPLVRQLQREAHQRHRSVRIGAAKRGLLQLERGPIGGGGGYEILRQVGARAKCHQPVVLLDIADRERLCGQTVDELVHRRRRAR